MKQWLLCFFYILSVPLIGQNLWVDISSPLNEVSEASLDPPFTAGADYANELLLESKAYISVTEVPRRSPWCLTVQGQNPSSSVASILVRPDYTSVSSQPWNNNLPTTITLSTAPQPLFSGEGSLEGLIIEFLLSGAQLEADWEPREVSIEWTVVSGECLL